MQNPDVVRSEEAARRYGINCVSLAHMALRELFQVELPSNLLCAELYADRRFFAHIASVKDIMEGDLVWFGVDNPSIDPDAFVPHYEQGRLINWREFPIKHVAIGLGEQDENGDKLLLHSTYYEGTNVIWPLSRFAKYERYAQTYGLSRLRRNN